MTYPVSRILDIATYLPDSVLGNDQLAAIYADWPATKIYEKTGISERRIAGSSQTSSDMAVEAARHVFTRGLIKPDDVDFIIFCTQTPDYILPTTACLIQDRLGISSRAGAFDVNLGCSGYVYGLSLAKGLIETSAATCVLLLTADTYSKYIHPMDKSVRTIFGDAASATVIVSTNMSSEHIGPFVFGTDGSGGKNLRIEAGMSRLPKSRDTSKEYSDSSGNVRTQEDLCMNGPEIMAFTLREVPKVTNDLLKKAGKTVDEIDYFIMHQANRFVLEALRRKLRISNEKLPILMQYSGNTVSSSIPLAMYELMSQRRLIDGSCVALIGFGVGYSWAGCILKL